MRVIILIAGAVGVLAGFGLLAYALMQGGSIAAFAAALPVAVCIFGGLGLIGLASVMGQLEDLAVARGPVAVSAPAVASAAPAVVTAPLPAPKKAGDKADEKKPDEKKTGKEVPPLTPPHGAAPEPTVPPLPDAVTAGERPAPDFADSLASALDVEAPGTPSGTTRLDTPPPAKQQTPEELAIAKAAALSGAPRTAPLPPPPVKSPSLAPEPGADKAPPVSLTPEPSADKAPDIIVRPPDGPSQAPALGGVSRDDSVASAPASIATNVEAPPERAGPSILKSGIIENMAYTLYSDGSVDAELPEGKMHFASIAEWRSYMRGEG
ncbi:hypothetical protein GJW-30_1_03826 [Variibacter gotjawalensis]|uniref:Uncharacterized protein n=1 Tax=Variibacter gotjawalensis TaxID=1333996 RepID=A0A0S3PZA1_9BRAD|nr:hypothetical protein [Variibacter gotjawalensis]NIK47107.1 hypothetical protein [Variibacter gotjawalensis]RZS49009.1 hypothetical protein EV661_1433 [Variibacter gotjawalensis]BAT61269.1 hypothetical protein GJW-30_1_03826 [Variibacter gotjawalensis]